MLKPTSNPKLNIHEEPSNGEWHNRKEFGNVESNIHFLQKAAILNSTMNVLEIGCGNGKLLEHLLHNGYHMTGIDIKYSHLQHCKHTNGHVPLVNASGENQQFQDSSFDTVLSFDVFEHMPDPDAHLQAVHRMLKPHGYYLLQTPNKWTNSVFETIRWRSFTKWKHDHCSLHNYWELARRLRDHGFDAEYCDIPVVNNYFKQKIKATLGTIGLNVLKLINPDKLPRPLTPNFYVIAQKCS